MISKEKLIEHFNNAIQFEIDIKNEYDELIEQLNAEEVKGKLKRIRDWEIEHIKLAEELVEIAKKA